MRRAIRYKIEKENKDLSKPDFSGYVTKHDILCMDGVVIKHDAFRQNDGTVVPLMWQHDYSSPTNVLGHVVLQHMSDGIWGDAFVNKSELGQITKELVRHGDVTSFSIGAQGIVKEGHNVVGGEIYEVSIVLKGANPGAKILHRMTHSAYDGDSNDACIIYTGQENTLLHSVTEEQKENNMSKKTVGEVLATLTEEQEAVMEKALTEGPESLAPDEIDILETLDEDQETAMLMVASEMEEDFDDEDFDDDDIEDDDIDDEDFDDDDDDAIEDEDVDDDIEDIEHGYYDEGENTLKHNAFYGQTGRLTHSAVNTILEAAIDGKAPSLAATLHANGLQNIDLKHGLIGIDTLFPQTTAKKEIQIYNPGGQNVEKMIGMFYKSPMSRIKNIFANISEEEARARGYIKGNQKLDAVEELFYRETTPGTIMRRTTIDRDDMIDIKENGIDVIAFLQKVQYAKLQEEIVRAAFFGDGRPLTLSGGGKNPDKISEKHVRPIVKDDDLFTIKTTAQYWTDAVDQVLKAFPAYQGSGSPTLFINPFDLAKLQTLKDENGRYLYSPSTSNNQVPRDSDIAAYFRCSNVIEYRSMPQGQIVIGNLNDYAFGMSKDGQIATFDQFDIDFNQHKYLIECRLSGAIQTFKSFIHLTVTEPEVTNEELMKFKSTGLKQHPSWTTNTNTEETPGAKYASKSGKQAEADKQPKSTPDGTQGTSSSGGPGA